MFRLTREQIDERNEKKQLRSPDTGCIIVYEGLVRDHNLGQKVTALDLEGDAEQCLETAGKILHEVRRLFPVLDVRFIHRSGHLEVGDTVAWVGIASAHREAGYQASQYIIDQMKLLMPIRKREHYADGTSSGWLTYQEWAKRKTL